MKAEEKIVAFMFFSVVMQFAYSFEKKRTEFGGGGVERYKSRGTGGPNSSGR